MQKASFIFVASFLLFGATLFVNACKKEHLGCFASPQGNCACTLQYQPVCGCDSVTYGNPCEAECNGITNYRPGTCR